MLLRFLSSESSLAICLTGLLFWAPLPAGSVTPAGELFYRLAILGLLVLAVATASPTWRGPAKLALAGLAAVAALGLLQSLPWPAAAAAAISPEHARLYRQAVVLAGTADAASWLPLSLNAAVTRSSAVSWFAAAALLAVVLSVSRRARHRRWLLAALVAAALLQIGLGLARLSGEFTQGLGAVLLRPWGRLQGVYPNPNSLCFLLEMALVAVAAWSWCSWTRLKTVGRRRAAVLLPIGVWLGLFAAVVLTGSRAGLAAAVAATVVQAAALPWSDRGRRSAMVAAVLVLLGLGILIVAGAQLEISRYETVSLFEDNLFSRLLVVMPSLRLWRSFPWTGTGLGTFEDAFPLVAPGEIAPTLWNRAHNDPLELLVTGGVVGFGLGCLVAAALVGPIWRALRHGGRAEARAAGLAGLGALAAAGVHELGDFGLVIPANSMAFLVIVGSAAATGLTVAAEPSPE